MDSWTREGATAIGAGEYDKAQAYLALATVDLLHRILTELQTQNYLAKREHDRSL